jgi:hypothetical protein
MRSMVEGRGAHAPSPACGGPPPPPHATGEEHAPNVSAYALGRPADGPVPPPPAPRSVSHETPYPARRLGRREWIANSVKAAGVIPSIRLA